MALLRYLRLWRQFLLIAIVREAEYRARFFLNLVAGLAQLGVALLTFVVLFHFTDEVAGWTRAEVLILVGIYRMMDGVINLQLAPNLRAVSEAIRTGEMDFFLLRPISTQFLVSTRVLNLHEGVNILIGLGLVLYVADAAGVQWHLSNVLAAITFGIVGLVGLYTLWFLTVTCSFWLVHVTTLDEIFYGLFAAGQYPVSFFGNTMRALLTFVVPVAFATTFPAEALLGTVDLRLLLAGTVCAGIGLTSTHLFWRYAIRHYTSASS